jgi:hypothetical protein
MNDEQREVAERLRAEVEEKTQRVIDYVEGTDLSDFEKAWLFGALLLGRDAVKGLIIAAGDPKVGAVFMRVLGMTLIADAEMVEETFEDYLRVFGAEGGSVANNGGSG